MCPWRVEPSVWRERRTERGRGTTKLKTIAKRSETSKGLDLVFFGDTEGPKEPRNGFTLRVDNCPPQQVVRRKLEPYAHMKLNSVSNLGYLRNESICSLEKETHIVLSALTL